MLLCFCGQGERERTMGGNMKHMCVYGQDGPILLLFFLLLT